MGEGSIQLWHGGRSQVVNVPGMVSWAAEVPGLGLALCNEPLSTLSVLAPSTGHMLFDVPLAPLSNPVGAVFSQGKVYVACFGADTDSGIAVVDPFTGQLEATYLFPRLGGQKHFVHNVYAFQWGEKTEIFAAVLGNPWAWPEPVTGKGLVRLDRGSGTFLTNTTTEDLNARSAVQQSDGVFYVLTQEPRGGPTQLARLERQGPGLVKTANTFLPARSGGDGGADVFLGDKDMVFCTDRTAGKGKLYSYSYSGSFEMVSSKNTGHDPRFATALGRDIVVCNKGDASLTTFEELAQNPRATNPTTKVEGTVPQVSFFITGCA